MRKRLVFLALLLGVWIGCGDTGDWTLSPQTAEYIEESCPKGMPLSYCTMLRKGISAMIATDDPGCSKHGTAFKRDYYNGLVRYDSDLGDYAVTLAGAPDQHFAITFGSQAFVSFEELLDTMFHEEHHHLTGSADEGLMDSYAADCTVLAMKGLGDSNDPVEF